MLQPISLVVATLWSDEAATFLVKALHDLQAANLQWSFEVIVVICHATPLKGEDIPAAPTGLPFTTRIYQTHSTNLEEGEALGAWLAYGDVLTFWRLMRLNRFLVVTDVCGGVLEENLWRKETRCGKQLERQCCASPLGKLQRWRW